MLGTGGSEFYDLWAKARAELANGVPASFPERLTDLQRLATTSRERVLIAPIEIDYGARADDHQAVSRGLNRLRGAGPLELADAVRSIPDLTILGSAEDRRNLLMPLVRPELPDDDPAVGFIDDPGPADAKLIVSGSWSAQQQLDSPLARELRLWVVWAALDSWLAYRHIAYLDLITADAVALRHAEPGWWEFGLARAIATLATKGVDDATHEIGVLNGRLSSSLGWARQRIARTMSAYALLAGSAGREWSVASPAPLLTPKEATSDIEALAFSLGEMARDARKARQLDAEDSEVLRRHPWRAFCWFTTAPAGPVLDSAADALLACFERPGDVRALPWPGRTGAFADACLRLSDRSKALRLLESALDEEQAPELRGAFVEVLEKADPPEFVGLSSDLRPALARAVADLDPRKQLVLARQGVFRAVIDGSNVVWGGKSRRAGAVPSMHLLDTVLQELESAGYFERVLFFDARTRHDLGEQWARVERLQATGSATVTRGPADPHVIDRYLEDIQHSEIVTGDEYRDWVDQRPGFSANKHRALRRFFFDDRDRITWMPPLDQPLGSR